MSSKDASETARQREVFKYYQPTVRSKHGDAVPPLPQSSHDTSLTAYAQLGALRLNARRGIISLVARDEEYIIAEATRTLSLRSDAVYQENDVLWKGESIARRCEGPCSIAMDHFTGILDGNRDHLLVRDLSEDERFRKMAPVSQYPFMKFYITVPLISPLGIVVGAFCIVDDEPRNGVAEHEIEFMKDISLMIMRHLEARRVKQQHIRAERMVRGLGLYVEGKSSLREWWLNVGHKTAESEVNDEAQRGEDLTQQADRQFGIQDLPHPLATAAVSRMPSVSNMAPRHPDNVKHNEVSNRPYRGREDVLSFTSLSATLSDIPESIISEDKATSNAPRGTRSATSASDLVREKLVRETSTSTEESSGALLQEANLFGELKETFGRASNLIRESIGVDGVVFLDASVGTFGGSSTKSDIGFNGPLARNHQVTPRMTSSSDEMQYRIDGSKPTSSQSSSEKMCGVLGYSTYTRSSLNRHASSNLPLDFTEKLLRKLLRRYPHGKIFHFDDEGSLSCSEDDVRRTISRNGRNTIDDTRSTGQSQNCRKIKMSKEAEGKAIMTILPRARCVAFFPLWDTHKERWFAGSFVWSETPTRVFDLDEDLIYLASFGNSIMAEVSRLNAVVSSQAKDSFVSSISHELRSPLHGLLASVEFLRDTPMIDIQEEMVSIIDSCGKTLLDIINHVLDFSKLKGSSTDKREKNKKSSRSKHAQRSPTSSKTRLVQNTSAVDLSVLTEEVLEGMCAGSRFFSRPSMEYKPTSSPVDSHLSLTETPVVPMIIVDVDWRQSWRFHVDPGAWRRLIMNIFGNALKYTETGFVRVMLGSSEDSVTTDQSSSSAITLTVTDSGKGISKEFLHHHLYTPFAQEDSLAVGTGLGLSIVRHIVNDLHGFIDIESEQDLGTEIRVSMPLVVAKSSHSHEAERDTVARCREQVKGWQAFLVGFDIFPDITDEPTGILSVEAKVMFSFKDSLTSLLRDWFGMNVSHAATVDQFSPSVHFLTDSTFSNLQGTGWSDSHPAIRRHRDSLLVILCTRTYQPQFPANRVDSGIVYVQQPIGPHKLAATLLRYLNSKSRHDPFAKISVPDVPKKLLRTYSGEGLPIAVSSLADYLAPHTLLLPKGSDGKLKISVAVPSPSSSEEPVIISGARDNVTSADLQNTDTKSPIYVLLVEDNAINLKLLSTYMDKLGIDYATAENGLRAVQRYQEATRPFNLVIMDISMPVMDGLEASRRIRIVEQEMKRERVPVVAITGAASESTRYEAFSAGIDQFLTKPVALKVVKKLVEEYSTPSEV